MEGVQLPTGFFDPLGFSNTSPQALAWYRACELKHGRVAMLACVGFGTELADIHFPGSLAVSSIYPGSKVFTADVTFEQLGQHPLSAWANIPDVGKWQIFSVILALELYVETRKPHYARGGDIGKIDLLWDPVGQIIRGKPITETLSDEKRRTSRDAELANGRLAMIGAMGFSAAACIPGSVP
ncbi:chlorophyll a/b-binding protein domain-containing protein, partial [Pelagophyceae sp. CCMP2097]